MNHKLNQFLSEVRRDTAFLDMLKTVSDEAAWSREMLAAGTRMGFRLTAADIQEMIDTAKTGIRRQQERELSDGMVERTFWKLSRLSSCTSCPEGPLTRN